MSPPAVRTNDRGGGGPADVVVVGVSGAVVMTTGEPVHPDSAKPVASARAGHR
jgi:hypothetical protein